MNWLKSKTVFNQDSYSSKSNSDNEVNPGPMIHNDNEWTTQLHIPFIVNDFNGTGAVSPDVFDVMTATALD